MVSLYGWKIYNTYTFYMYFFTHSGHESSSSRFQAYETKLKYKTINERHTGTLLINLRESETFSSYYTPGVSQ